jgi:hypothetical protein
MPAKIQVNWDYEALRKGLAALFSTYSDMLPYQHRFNDELVKSHLLFLSFLKREGLINKFLDYNQERMSFILDRIRGMVEKEGKEKALFSLFEGTNYQFYEGIKVEEGKRSFTCPYEPIIDISMPSGGFGFDRQFVCDNWCIPKWESFSDRIGVTLEYQPGTICRVNLK